MKFHLLLTTSILVCFSALAQNLQHFKTNQTDTFYGKVVHDPFRLLEDTSNAKVKAWMKAEAEKTTKFFQSLPNRDKLYNEVTAAFNNAKQDEINAITFHKEQFYVTKRYPGQDNFNVYEIDKNGNEKLFLDPVKAHPEITSRNIYLSNFGFDDDAPYLYYGLVIRGNESGFKSFTKHAETGMKFPDSLYLTEQQSIAFFDPERNDAFYYTKSPYRQKPGVDPLHWGDSSTLHYHIIGADPATDKTIIAVDTSSIKRDVNDYVGVTLSKDLPYVYAKIKNKVKNQFRIYTVPKNEFNATKTKWKMITDFSDEISSYKFIGNYAYLTSQKDAPNSKVLRVDLSTGNLSNAVTLIPNSKMLIKEIAITKNELLVIARGSGQDKLLRIKHGNNTVDSILTPLRGNLKIAWADEKESSFIISAESWVKPIEYFTYNPSNNSFAHSIVQKYKANDIAPLEVKEVSVKSHDGVMVPMTIIYKKGLKLDGKHPLRLFGYGAYGITEDPQFWPDDMVFYDRGGIRAIAHVRGGGIYGEDWHKAGQKETKPNTWKDYIACAQYLIANKYATNKSLIAYGGSAGGITVGRAITERPDLFGAAMIIVGALDMVRFEKAPNGQGNTPEFGSVATKTGFEALYEMSTYHHVKQGVKYPTVIFSHGVNDSRVPVWTSLKTAAAMQEATTSGKPVFLKLDFDNGHGFQETQSSLVNRIADNTAFWSWIANGGSYHGSESATTSK